MSNDRDRRLASLLELQLALVRHEAPAPAPEPLLPAASSPLPRGRRPARVARRTRH